MSLRSAVGGQINAFLGRFGYRLARLGGRIELDPADGGDDYDWSLYHLDYSAQIASLEPIHTLRLFEGDFSLEDGALKLREGLRPLHPNHLCLYETIGALAPASVIEVGCGGGDHLHNLGVLYPALQRRGLDRSEGQLSFLRSRSPHLSDLVQQLDVTLPPSRDLPKAEVVYSQAVIMHIQAGNSHLVALSNMFRMAERSVVLMENWKRHPFMDDIRMLHARGMIDWDNLKFYHRRYNGRPHIMIVSRDDLPFEKLDDYDALVKAMNG